MTEQKKLSGPSPAGTNRADILMDDQLAAAVSSYLDGQLMGEELERFEALLRNNSSLAREVREMRNIELQLMEMGSDILSEPVPDALIEALSSKG